MVIKLYSSDEHLDIVEWGLETVYATKYYQIEWGEERFNLIRECLKAARDHRRDFETTITVLYESFRGAWGTVAPMYYLFCSQCGTTAESLALFDFEADDGGLDARLCRDCLNEALGLWGEMF